MPAGCMSDGECAAGKHCNLQTGECEAADPSSAGSAGSAAIKAESTNVAAQAQCTTKPQSGCAPGTVCRVANSSGDTSCYATGSGAYGDACATVGDCKADFLCVYGQCRAPCDSAKDCPSAPYAACAPYPERDGAPAIAGSSFCSLQCNPADSQNLAKNPDFVQCLAGTGCYSHATATGATSCYTSGDVPAGGACSDMDLCKPNYVCLTTQGVAGGRCTPYCLMGRTKCATGSCQSFATPKKVSVKGSLVELGYCG